MKDQAGRELELAGYEEGTERLIVKIDLSLSSDSSLIRRLPTSQCGRCKRSSGLNISPDERLQPNPIRTQPSPATSLLATAKLANFQAAAMENIFERK